MVSKNSSSTEDPKILDKIKQILFLMYSSWDCKNIGEIPRLKKKRNLKTGVEIWADARVLLPWWGLGYVTKGFEFLYPHGDKTRDGILGPFKLGI